jgi:CubicO group peptidase (beta-lactamase class C family)
LIDDVAVTARGQRLDLVLAMIDAWPAEHAAAAVVGPEGLIAKHGGGRIDFEWASITKLVIALAVLIAVERDVVGLDDPAGPPGATVRHLLAHTAGYAFESNGGVIAQPGTRRIYSNRVIEELAAHFATASGIPFGDYLAEAVLEPLGLEHTELRGSPAHEGWGTATDLARFATELLAPTLLAPETTNDLVTVQFPGLSGVLPGIGRFDPLDWGLGVERNFGRPRHWAGERVPGTAFGHFGGSGTFLWADHGLSLAAVCLTDRDFGDWALAAWPPLCDAIVAEHSQS